MHNKSFTADSQATIIGGRNVGDEYFGATDQVLFADLDVMAIGPAVQEVSADFDRYWNSRPIPLTACSPPRILSPWRNCRRPRWGLNGARAPSLTPVRCAVHLSCMSCCWGACRWNGLRPAWAKRRKPLLEAGVSLYELRRLSPNTTTRMRAGHKGSSASSLHGKTFSVDRSRVFIGSFNFDPRSAELNTEMGFIIDSPALAQRIGAAFDRRIPNDAYQVHLSDGQLYWVERRGREVWWHDVEPGTSFWQRAGVWFISLLPIEWLL